MPGLFITIDGTDGSGKKTQTAILCDRLRAEGREVLQLSFPQYGKRSAGLVEKYLAGDYGSAEAVGPYRASIFYACDRYDASFIIKQAIADGKIVITDRYALSNMAHQGGKILDDGERQKFFNWLQDLEYDIFQIPRPDLNIILHVPASIGQGLVESRGNAKDIHELDISHLEHAEKVYLELAKLPQTKLIECVENNQIMSREDIAELVWQNIQKILT